MASSSQAEIEARLQREKEYHNDVFSSGARAVTDKYYRTTKRSIELYHSLLQTGARNQNILEYGCGPGSAAFGLAEAGAHVTGIDIADVAIEMAAKEAADRGLKATFAVMNAEVLTFDTASFDKIVGTGILHHLELEKSYAEIARCLKPDGVAVFSEPMGHNPLINLYRRLTPKLRTEDEHPMLMKDINLAREYFSDVRVHFFNLTSIATVVLHKTPLFKPALRMFDALDKFLFTVLPPLRRWAWISIIELRKPKAEYQKALG